MSKTLIPQNDRVLVKPVDEGEQMYGILLSLIWVKKNLRWERS